jgi:CTD small phosphatase-like protein 2
MLPKRPGYLHKKTIIFDMDETLVHCSDEISPNLTDISLPITFPSGQIAHAGVNIRPYARECLRAANQDFEVIVFTASNKWYADVILDYLDPQHTVIHHRLYRDSCVMTGGVLVKDLRIFANRNLEDLVIVDNMVYNFAFQLDNGIPIRSWKEDEADRELVLLCDYMKKLAAVPDVRELNAQTFRLKTLIQDYTSQTPKPINLSIR